MSSDDETADTIADAILGHGYFEGPPVTQAQQETADEFWRQKIAEADAGDGFARVRLSDIPGAPGSAVYLLPSWRATNGRQVILHGTGQAVTGDPALDADTELELEPASMVSRRSKHVSSCAPTHCVRC